MRRPSLVKKYVYKRSTGYPGWVPTNGRRTQICRGQDFLGPLSLITVKSSERNGGVKGAHFVRGLRTLDTVVPFPRMKGKGKGAGGLRGLAPWRSMRQRLMARGARRFRRVASALPVGGPTGGRILPVFRRVPFPSSQLPFLCKGANLSRAGVFCPA